MATSEDLTRLFRQFNEIIKRVNNGSLNPSVVRRGLQDIIEKAGDTDPEVIEWHTEPKQQIQAATEIWGDSLVIPDIPAFTPETASEVLLLHVPDEWSTLWALAQGATLETGAHLTAAWVAFDPERGTGERPNVFASAEDAADAEIFSALIQFPEWPQSWRRQGSAPILHSKAEATIDGNLAIAVDSKGELTLTSRSSNHCHRNRANPSVRKLS